MQKIKVKKIEKKRFSKNLSAFLVYRQYPKSYLDEYVVCMNYDFTTNTYTTGTICERLDQAYKAFNQMINDFKFAMLKKTEDNFIEDFDNTEIHQEQLC